MPSSLAARAGARSARAPILPAARARPPSAQSDLAAYADSTGRVGTRPGVTHHRRPAGNQSGHDGATPTGHGPDRGSGPGRTRGNPLDPPKSIQEGPLGRPRAALPTAPTRQAEREAVASGGA